MTYSLRLDQPQKHFESQRRLPNPEIFEKSDELASVHVRRLSRDAGNLCERTEDSKSWSRAQETSSRLLGLVAEQLVVLDRIRNRGLFERRSLVFLKRSQRLISLFSSPEPPLRFCERQKGEVAYVWARVRTMSRFLIYATKTARGESFSPVCGSSTLSLLPSSFLCFLYLYDSSKRLNCVQNHTEWLSLILIPLRLWES